MTFPVFRFPKPVRPLKPLQLPTLFAANELGDVTRIGNAIVHGLRRSPSSVVGAVWKVRLSKSWLSRREFAGF